MVRWGCGVRTAVVCAMLSLVGCVQILGLHDRSESADGGSITGPSVMMDASNTSNASDAGAEAAPAVITAGRCGGVLHASESCASCMDQKCCDQSTACAGEAACQEATSCLAGCSGAVCRARCGVFYTHPNTLFALRACRAEQCAGECNSTCGEFTAALSACEACIQGSCCTGGVACAKNVACSNLEICQGTCLPGSISCPEDCAVANPEGVSDFSDWNSCVQNSCGAACQTLNWQCLDAPAVWPKPRGGGNVTFSVSVADLTTERPYVGTTVKACGKLDVYCTSPIDQKVTDAEGLVSLTVSVGLLGFDGYLDLTGGVNDKGKPLYPALWYPKPPVIANGWRTKIEFVSTEDFALLGLLTGIDIDQTRGHFVANAQDCSFSAASGVSFSADVADDKTRSFYFVGGVPNTAAPATDQSAIGGLVNLPARLALITATSTTGGGNRRMGSLTFIVRPGVFTTSSFPPIP